VDGSWPPHNASSGPSSPTSRQPKWHLDRFSHFSTARTRDQQTDRQTMLQRYNKKRKGSSYSFTEHRVPELIPVLGGQPAGDVNHKPHSRLLLLSARPAVTPATLKRAATNFAAW